MNKKILALVMVAALAMPIHSAVFAAESDGSDTQTEALATNSYIVLVPSYLNVSQYDETHVSDEYSTNDYKILFYQAGETVVLTANYDGDIVIRDSATMEPFTDFTKLPNGNIIFTMPQSDLYFEHGEGETLAAPADTETSETTAETTPETETATEPATEPATEAPTEPETEPETEPQTEAPDGHNESMKMNVNLLTDDLTIDVDTVSGNKATINGANDFNTNENLSFVTVTANDPASVISMIVKRNGFRVDDHSEVLSTAESMTDGVFKADIKDNLDTENDVYTFKFTTETEPETEAVTEAPVEETEAPAPETEAPVEETAVPEPAQEETSAPAPEETQAETPAETQPAQTEYETVPKDGGTVRIAPMDETLTVNTKSLNVREQPSANAEKTGLVYEGQEVHVDAETIEDVVWYHISYTEDGAEKSGYVRGSFLK